MKPQGGLSETWWAHRGAGKAAPENTLAAIRLGAAHGFKAVEFDAMLTADGEVVIHHDFTIGRTTSDVSGHIAAGTRVDALTLTQMQTLDAGRWHSDAFGNEPVPTLAQALALCDTLGLAVNLELKREPAPVSNVASVKSLVAVSDSCLAVASLKHLQQHPGLLANTVISSFHLPLLYAVRAAGYQGALAILFEALPRQWAEHAQALDADAIHLHHKGLQATEVRRIHTTGRAVRVYTVNDASLATQLLSWGVDGLFTDLMTIPRDVQNLQSLL